MRVLSKRLTVTVCVALVAGGGAVSEAALPKRGRLYVGTAAGGWPGAPGVGRDDVSLKVSASGKRFRVRGIPLCGRNPRPVINRIKILGTGSFKARRSYATIRPSSEKFAWTFKFSGRFTSSTRANGRLTEHLETSGGARGTNSVCDTPKNLRWKVKLFSE